MAEARIGVDIVEISRMKSILEKTPSFARRVFTKRNAHIAILLPVLPLIMPAVLLLVRRCLRRLERALARASAAKTFR